MKIVTLLEDLAWVALRDGIGDELDDDEDEDSLLDDKELELGVNSLSKSISLSSVEVVEVVLFALLEEDWFNLAKLALDWTKWIMCDVTSEFFTKNII